MIQAAQCVSKLQPGIPVRFVTQFFQYFVQIGDDYMRQGRRNLDGYRMYYDLPESGVGGDHLSDLFDVNEVFDRSRPTPVSKMTE